MPRLARVFFCTLSISLSASAQSILVCGFERTGLVYQESSGEFSAEIGEGPPIQLSPDELDSETVVISGLDTEKPVLKGNWGESVLTILRTIEHKDFGKVVWLAETPPLGGVNIYTVFLKSKTVIESKQQIFIKDPLGSIAIGKCK